MLYDACQQTWRRIQKMLSVQSLVVGPKPRLAMQTQPKTWSLISRHCTAQHCRGHLGQLESSSPRANTKYTRYITRKTPPDQRGMEKELSTKIATTGSNVM